MLTLRTRALVIYWDKLCLLSQIVAAISQMISEPIACLYLFQQISHGGSKYGHQIPDFFSSFFYKMCYIFELLSALACHVESVKSGSH